MDILSHAGWGYATLRWRGEREARIGALCGAAPDLLAFAPSMTHHVLTGGLRGRHPEHDPDFWRTPGPPAAGHAVRLRSLLPLQPQPRRAGGRRGRAPAGAQALVA